MILLGIMCNYVPDLKSNQYFKLSETLQKTYSYTNTKYLTQILFYNVSEYFDASEEIKLYEIVSLNDILLMFVI